MNSPKISGKESWKQKIRDYPIALEISEQRGCLAVAGIKGDLLIYSAEDGKLLNRWQTEQGGLTAMALLEKSGILATGGENGTVKFWKLENGKLVRTETLGDQWVDFMEYSRDGKLAFGSGRKVRVESADGTCLIEEAYDSPVREACFNTDGSLIFFASTKGIRSKVIETKASGREFPFDISPYRMTISPDGNWLACGLSDMSVRFFDLLRESKESLAIGPFRHKPRLMSWSPGSHRFATADGSRVYLVDQEQLARNAEAENPPGEVSREPIQPLELHREIVTALSFHPTRNILAIGYSDGRITLRDTNNELTIFEAYISDSEVNHLLWSNSGEQLFVTCDEGSISAFTLKKELI